MGNPGCQGGGGRTQWRFLTNHGALLLRIADDPTIRLAEAARDVRISQRAAQMILRDLVDAGLVSRKRVGRRNSYTVHRERLLHPGGRVRVGDLLNLLPADDHAWRAARSEDAAQENG